MVHDWMIQMSRSKQLKLKQKGVWFYTMFFDHIQIYTL